MKTVSIILQVSALLACFLAHQAFTDEMTGVRRAIETTAGKCRPGELSAPSVYFCPQT